MTDIPSTASVLVSVIIPCYNQAHFLPRAVASVVAQTLPNWELIIIDDGSPDDAATVAQRLINAHPERAIRLIRQPNRGLSAARNAGIQAARAAYILPLDSDDAIAPDMLALTVAALDAHPAVGFVYTDVERFGGESNILRTEGYSLDRLRFDCMLMPASLFRREAWLQVGGYDEQRRMCEDWDFWLRLAEAGWQGLHIAQPLLRYYRGSTGLLSRAQRQDLELRAQLVRDHPRLYEADVNAWAARVLSPEWSSNLKLHSRWRWWRAYLSYLALIARHYPAALLRILARPILWHMPIAWQGRMRALVRLARLQR